MDHDGTNQGFACPAIARLSEQAGIPIIASGGRERGKIFIRLLQKEKQMQHWLPGCFIMGGCR